MTSAPSGDGPHVLFDLDFEDGIFFLVLSNVGSAPAYDVRVEFDRPVKELGGTVTVSEMRLFKGLSLLRPGKTIRLFVDTAEQRFRKRTTNPISARVYYRDHGRRKFSEAFRHDFGIYQDWISIVSTPPSSDDAS